MDYDLVLKALIAVAPVLALLFVFDRLDAFNLINLRDIVLLLLGGGAIAALSFMANLSVMDGFPIGFSSYTRYVAPPIEESLKALPILALFVFNRLGFKLDAAIAGFAVGAGFSMVENFWYLREYSESNVSAWLVRGFGTAIMHGGATALFAVISHEMTERQAEAAATRYRFNPLLFIPGLALAIAFHSAFNHFAGQPVAIMAITLLLVPMVLFFTFARSERATQQWLKRDHDVHRQALDDIRAGRFADSETGRAIKVMAERLRGGASADAFAYLELKTELVLRAEELIMASQAGVAAEIGAGDREKFDRLEALEHRLGKSALAALSSRLAFSRNDLWELGRLRARARKT
jgi:RsiW-degrading membrane proteinase PrsW (M82 family)